MKEEEEKRRYGRKERKAKMKILQRNSINKYKDNENEKEKEIKKKEKV